MSAAVGSNEKETRIQMKEREAEPQRREKEENTKTRAAQKKAQVVTCVAYVTFLCGCSHTNLPLFCFFFAFTHGTAQPTRNGPQEQGNRYMPSPTIMHLLYWILHASLLLVMHRGFSLLGPHHC